MTNQTPHTPTPGFQIRPPVITKELQRLVEENKKLIKTALPAMEENERRKEEERLKNEKEFIEIAWYKLDKENLWKPQNPEIVIHLQVTNETIPQAWEHNWYRYYNFLWAQAEAEFLWKEIPTKLEWQMITKLFWQDWERLSKELNMPMAGYRRWTNGPEWQNMGGSYWSSSLVDWSTSPINKRWNSLDFDNTHIRSTDKNFLSTGYSVRCFKKWFQKPAIRRLAR